MLKEFTLFGRSKRLFGQDRLFKRLPMILRIDDYYQIPVLMSGRTGCQNYDGSTSSESGQVESLWSPVGGHLRFSGRLG